MPALRCLKISLLALLINSSVTGSRDVINLNAKTFQDQLKDRDIVLVLFHVPWCHHCQTLMPKYNDAAKALKAENIPLAKLNCEIFGDKCTEYDVHSYPRLIVFRNGKYSEVYNGENEKDDIVQYMKDEAQETRKKSDSLSEEDENPIYKNPINENNDDEE